MSVDVTVLRVFTDARGDFGNPLGVVDAATVDPERHQRIATELGYSETIFINLPVAGRSSADARIYTPAGIVTRSEASRSVPWVDQVDSCFLEVSGVACGKCRAAGSCDAGDLDVANLHRATSALARRCDGPGSESRRLVEGLDTTIEILGQELRKYLLKAFAAPSTFQ